MTPSPQKKPQTNPRTFLHFKSINKDLLCKNKSDLWMWPKKSSSHIWQCYNSLSVLKVLSKRKNCKEMCRWERDQFSVLMLELVLEKDINIMLNTFKNKTNKNMVIKYINQQITWRKVQFPVESNIFHSLWPYFLRQKQTHTSYHYVQMSMLILKLILGNKEVQILLYKNVLINIQIYSHKNTRYQCKVNNNLIMFVYLLWFPLMYYFWLSDFYLYSSIYR